MAGDATAVAPNVYIVVEENDRVRVLKYRVGPGETTELHSHPDHVAITASAGRFRFTTADGDSMEVELEAGQALFLEPVTTGPRTSEIQKPRGSSSS